MIKIYFYVMLAVIVSLIIGLRSSVTVFVTDIFIINLVYFSGGIKSTIMIVYIAIIN